MSSSMESTSLPPTPASARSFTIKMPFPLYLRFKALNKQLKDAAADEDKEKYTMTAWVNSAVDKVILPALEELLREGEQQLQPETVA